VVLPGLGELASLGRGKTTGKRQGVIKREGGRRMLAGVVPLWRGTEVRRLVIRKSFGDSQNRRSPGGLNRTETKV